MAAVAPPMITLIPLRDYGAGAVTPAELAATRDDPTNPLGLPSDEELILYNYLTAELRATGSGHLEIRLWMSREDATTYTKTKAADAMRGTLYQLQKPLPKPSGGPN